MGTEISHISDTFDPALKICIANAVCSGHRHVICLKISDERGLGVAFNFVVYILDKLFMIPGIGKVCGVFIAHTPYLQEK